MRYRLMGQSKRSKDREHLTSIEKDIHKFPIEVESVSDKMDYEGNQLIKLPNGKTYSIWHFEYEEIIFSGSISAIMNYRVIVDEPVKKGFSNSMVFDRWCFWLDVKVGDRVEVVKKWIEDEVTISFYKIRLETIIN